MVFDDGPLRLSALEMKSFYVWLLGTSLFTSSGRLGSDQALVDKDNSSSHLYLREVMLKWNFNLQNMVNESIKWFFKLILIQYFLSAVLQL